MVHPRNHNSRKSNLCYLPCSETNCSILIKLLSSSVLDPKDLKKIFLFCGDKPGVKTVLCIYMRYKNLHQEESVNFVSFAFNNQHFAQNKDTFARTWVPASPAFRSSVTLMSSCDIPPLIAIFYPQYYPWHISVIETSSLSTWTSSLSLTVSQLSPSPSM